MGEGEGTRVSHMGGLNSYFVFLQNSFLLYCIFRKLDGQRGENQGVSYDGQKFIICILTEQFMLYI